MPDGPTPTASHACAPLPADEADRLAALHSFAVLDTPPEARFDELTRLAAQLTGMSVALVSLVDERRQWFKSAHGTDLDSTPREEAFCAHALLAPGELLVVDDTTADPRFRENPLVTGAPGLRAYAGAPLVGTDGQPLGTLCVLDTRPRRLGDAQLEALQVLSHQVVAQLEHTRAQRRLAEAESTLRRRVGPSLRREDPVEGLERALDRGELVVHYQPFWDVQDRGRSLSARVSGAAALVRWQHPDRGLLLPGAFVPAMEAQGLATRLGEVVLGQALTQLAAWQRRGLLPEGFRMHVNIAAEQLHGGEVGRTVQTLLEQAGAAPEGLCLEVTESALLDATSFTPQSARDLVDAGLSLALDDFGTGFSSLTQLRSYPFSCVKVDRSFVAGLGVDAQDDVIVDTVVSMAHRLGLQPVCEGVETPAQLDRVVEVGCTTVQGWLFGRACEADRFTDDVLLAGEQVLLRAQRPAGAPAPRSFELPVPLAAPH